MAIIVKNWAKNLQLQGAELVAPESRDESIALITRAAQANRPVRVLGSLHSWSDVLQSNPAGLLVNTHKLNKIISIDLKSMRVWVEGGIKLSDLVVALADAGLSLTNQGSILDQTIAGAIATGTHG